MTFLSTIHYFACAMIMMEGSICNIQGEIINSLSFEERLPFPCFFKDQKSTGMVIERKYLPVARTRARIPPVLVPATRSKSSDTGCSRIRSSSSSIWISTMPRIPPPSRERTRVILGESPRWPPCGERGLARFALQPAFSSRSSNTTGRVFNFVSDSGLLLKVIPNTGLL